jgi:cleavage and polyadenylation specificity factor subunit 1
MLTTDNHFNPFSQGPTLFEWMPDVDLNLGMPSRHIFQGRSYTNIVFEPTTSLLVAASLVQAQFSSYDEEGTEMWTPDGRFYLTCLVFLKY